MVDEDNSKLATEWLFRQEPCDSSIDRFKAKLEVAGIGCDLESLLDGFKSDCVSESEKTSAVFLERVNERYGWYNTRARDIDIYDINMGSAKHLEWAYFLKQRSDPADAFEFLKSFVKYLETEYSGQKATHGKRQYISEDHLKSQYVSYDHLNKVLSAVGALYRQALRDSLKQEKPSGIERHFLDTLKAVSSEPCKLLDLLFHKKAPDKNTRPLSLSYFGLADALGSVFARRKEYKGFQDVFKEVHKRIVQGDFDFLLDDESVYAMLEKFSHDAFRDRIYSAIKKELPEGDEKSIYIQEVAKKCQKAGRFDLEIELLIKAAQQRYSKNACAAAYDAFERSCELRDINHAAEAYITLVHDTRGSGCSITSIAALNDGAFKQEVFDKSIGDVSLSYDVDRVCNDFGLPAPSQVVKSVSLKLLPPASKESIDWILKHASLLDRNDRKQVEAAVIRESNSYATRILYEGNSCFYSKDHQRLHFKLARGLGISPSKVFYTCFFRGIAEEFENFHRYDAKEKDKATQEIRSLLKYARSKGKSCKSVEEEGAAVLDKIQGVYQKCQDKKRLEKIFKD